MKAIGKTPSKQKKRLFGAMAGLFAASVVTLGALFDSPAELLVSENEEAPGVGTSVVSVGKRLAPRFGQAGAGAAGVPDRLRACLLELPQLARAVFLLPLWCVGRAGIALVAALIRSPVGQAFFGALLNALVLLVLFTLAYKLIFPGRSLAALLKKRSILALILSGALLRLADALLKRYCPDSTAVSICIKLLLGLLVLTLLCGRILPKRTRKT